MTKSEILTEIEKKLEEIKSLQYSWSEKDLFIKKFLECNNLNDLDEILKIDPAIATMAFMLSLDEESELEVNEKGYLMCSDDDEIVEYGFEFRNTFKEMRKNAEKIGGYLKMCEENELAFKYTIKEKKNFFHDFLKENVDFKMIKGCFKVIKDYGNDLVEKERQYEYRKKKEYKIYNRLKQNLESALKKEEIIDYLSIVSKLPDEKLRMEILKLIYTHNIVYQKRVEEEYNVLSKNSKAEYHLLLQGYGIDIVDDEIEIIRENSYEDIKRMLELLKKLKITDKDDVLAILFTSNVIIVERLYDLRKKGIVSDDFIKNNRELFVENSMDRKTLWENINMLNEKKINPYHFENNQDLLLIDSSIFTKNIGILMEYDLIMQMNPDLNYQFLVGDNLEIIIDQILELGYESNLEESLNLLNYDINRWKRLYILKELDITIEDTKSLEDMLSSKDFIVPDSALDDYIYNAANNDEMLEFGISKMQLENLSSTKRTYCLGDIIISKNKVERSIKENVCSEECIPLQILTRKTIVNERSYNLAVEYLRK